MSTHSLSLGPAIGITIAGAIAAVVVTIWLRSRTLARFEAALGSHERAEWGYAITFWLLAILLGLAYNRLGLIQGGLDVALTSGSTLAVLGIVWPPYMRDSAFTSFQHSVQRAVAVVIGVILLLLAAGHS
jgi:phosphate/sulfate permease